MRSDGVLTDMYDYSPTLYACSVAPLEDRMLFHTAYEAMPKARRQKTDQFYFPKDKRLSVGAELLLRYVLIASGISDLPETFEYGEQGKPFLPDHSLWFNLSHSGDWVLCAVAGCEVGCDIEKVAPVDLRVAKRFFFHSEYERIMEEPIKEKQTELFFRYWTLKESFMKATGLGMKLPLHDFEIVMGEEVSVLQSVDDRLYHFSEYLEIPGYCCSICTVGEKPESGIRIVDIQSVLKRLT